MSFYSTEHVKEHELKVVCQLCGKSADMFTEGESNFEICRACAIRVLPELISNVVVLEGVNHGRNESEGLLDEIKTKIQSGVMDGLMSVAFGELDLNKKVSKPRKKKSSKTKGTTQKKKKKTEEVNPDVTETSQLTPAEEEKLANVSSGNGNGNGKGSDSPLPQTPQQPTINAL